MCLLEQVSLEALGCFHGVTGFCKPSPLVRILSTVIYVYSRKRKPNVGEFHYGLSVVLGLFRRRLWDM